MFRTPSDDYEEPPRASLIFGAIGHVLRAVLVLFVGSLFLLAFFSWQAADREIKTAVNAAPNTGRFLQAADIQMFVQEVGRGTPVVLVHGPGAWSEAWRESMNRIAGAGFRAIAIDLPPFGFSQKPKPSIYGKQDQAKRILGALDALELERAILVAHSFSGAPAVEAAFLAPDRVRALVLIDAALDLKTDAEKPTGFTDVLLNFGWVRNGIVATFLTNPYFTKAAMQFFVEDRSHASNDWVQIYQRPLVVKGTTPAVSDWLHTVRVPAQASPSENPESYRALPMPISLIWGERDTTAPLEEAQKLVSLLPEAELIVIDGVGHIPQMEAPGKFNDALLKAIASGATETAPPPPARAATRKPASQQRPKR